MKTTLSFTLHNIEPDLYTALLSRARSYGTSLNRIAKELLRSASGLTAAKKKRDLSWLRTFRWTKAEARAFDKATRDTETINPADWESS